MSKDNGSLYQKIAIDMAERIYQGEFTGKTKIHGRSTLAGEYNVSPETVRRAIKLLEDMQVVTVTKGSGIYLGTKENAYRFIIRFKGIQTILALKKDIRRLLKEKQQIETQIEYHIDKVIEYSNRFKNSSPITPIEIEISSESHLIGKTISRSKFRQKTNGTIVGIIRGNQTIISPSPTEVFLEGDILLVAGKVGVRESAENYIFSE